MRVTLNGDVVSDDDARIYRHYGYSVISPDAVRQAITDNPPGDELVFEINSCGGSVYAGFEIYSLIRNAGCPTVAEVQSIAASAASTVMSACRSVMLSPVAQVMIHLPSTVTCGDQKAHYGSIGILDAVTESILNGYELKCGGKTDRARLKSLMEASTWLTAQEAVELGLADGILYLDDPAPENVINAVGGGLHGLASASGLPDIDELRARYEREQQGEPPDDGGDSFAGRRGALRLENNRFIKMGGM